MLSEDLQFFEGAFAVLNKVYFDEELPSVIITIQSTPKVYGHFTVNPVWTESIEKRSLREINLGADYLDRPIENVMASCTSNSIILCYVIYGNSNGYDSCVCMIEKSSQCADVKICILLFYSRGQRSSGGMVTARVKFIENNIYMR